ncbi:MAG: J domain-containing protein, partial [Thaumarchaeota archaeon]|nr:J domain-containing protein [Nitrososphaerota archaeon]
WMKPSLGKSNFLINIEYIQKMRDRLHSDAELKIQLVIGNECILYLLPDSTLKINTKVANSFEVLKATPNDTMDDIAGKYKKLMLKYQPDKNDSPNANQKTIEIKDAFDAIKNNYDPLQNTHRTFNKIRLKSFPDVTFDSILEETCRKEGWKWDTKSSTVLVNFDNTKITKEELYEMKKMLNIGPAISLGTFDNSFVITVDIYPNSDDEAQKWATGIMTEKISQNYVTLEGYEDIILDIKGLLPSSRLNMDLKKRTDYQSNDNMSIFWHTQAMEDWCL